MQDKCWAYFHYTSQLGRKFANMGSVRAENYREKVTLHYCSQENREGKGTTKMESE